MINKKINEELTEELVEQNIVTLIEDEDYNGGVPTWEIVASITAVTALFGVTSACTKACWRP